MQNKKISSERFFWCFMCDSWLDSVGIGAFIQLLTFWTLIIAIYFQPNCGFFLLSPLILLELRFGVTFRQFGDIPSWSRSHARRNSYRKQLSHQLYRNHLDFLTRKKKSWEKNCLCFWRQDRHKCFHIGSLGRHVPQDISFVIGNVVQTEYDIA